MDKFLTMPLFYSLGDKIQIINSYCDVVEGEIVSTSDVMGIMHYWVSYPDQDYTGMSYKECNLFTADKLDSFKRQITPKGKCECGAEKVGHFSHSTWCPKHRS